MFQYFDVYYVYSTSRYRPQLFLDQLEVGLAKFKIWIRKYRPYKLGQ